MRWLMVVWLGLWALFSLPWISSTSTPRWERVRPPRVRASSQVRADHVLNVVFYIPLARMASSVGWSLPICMITGVVMSATAEAAQLFSADRAPDGNHFIGNVGGTAAGVLGVVWHRRRNVRRRTSPPAA